VTLQDRNADAVLRSVQEKLQSAPEPPSAHPVAPDFEVHLRAHMRGNDQEMERLQALLKVREDWRNNVKRIKRDRVEHVHVVTHTCEEPDCNKWRSVCMARAAALGRREAELDRLLEAQCQLLEANGEEAAGIVEELRKRLTASPEVIVELWGQLRESTEKTRRLLDQDSSKPAPQHPPPVEGDSTDRARSPLHQESSTPAEQRSPTNESWTPAPRSSPAVEPRTQHMNEEHQVVRGGNQPGCFSWLPCFSSKVAPAYVDYPRSSQAPHNRSAQEAATQDSAPRSGLSVM